MPRQDPGEPYYRISIAEAAEMYGGDDAVVVDVRRPDEYTAGHVKDAIYITVDDILGRIGRACPATRTCSSSAPRACEAAWPARWPRRWVSTQGGCTTSKRAPTPGYRPATRPATARTGRSTGIYVSPRSRIGRVRHNRHAGGQPQRRPRRLGDVLLGVVQLLRSGQRSGGGRHGLSARAPGVAVVSGRRPVGPANGRGRPRSGGQAYTARRT